MLANDPMNVDLCRVPAGSVITFPDGTIFSCATNGMYMVNGYLAEMFKAKIEDR